MPSIGVSNKAFVSAITLLDKREIFRDVSDIFNEEMYTGISELMQGAGRYVKTSMPTYSTFVNEPLYTLLTVGATAPGISGRDVTAVLTAGTSGLARKGMMVIFPSTQVGIITNVTGSPNTLTIKMVANTPPTLGANANIGMFAMTVGAQNSGVDNIRYGLSNYTNKIQAFRETNVIDDIQANSQVEVNFNGQPYIVYKDLIEKALLFKSGINAVFVAGQVSDSSFESASPTITDPTGANAGAVQTTKGLDQYITQTAQNGGGIQDTVATPGTWLLSDQEDLITQLLANRCPKNYLAFCSSKAKIKIDNHLKSLGSANNIASVRINLDGKELDTTVDKLTYGGFTFEFMNLPILDHPALFSATNISKSVYYVPKDKVKVHGGTGYSPRMQVRYMDHGIKGGSSGSEYIGEWSTGSKAPSGPTDGENVWKYHLLSYQGLECLGTQHFARQIVTT